MPGPASISEGNIAGTYLLQLTLTPASVTSAGGNEQTFTCPGLKVGDYVEVSKPTTQNGLSIANTRVSANNVIAIAFANATAATITPTAAEVYTVCITRGENYNIAGTLPAGVVG